MTLLKTIDRPSDELDKESTTVGVFIDLSNAFDTVDHTILSNKLDYYVIKGLALESFKNYLSDRQQYVEIEIYYFSFMPMICHCVINLKKYIFVFAETKNICICRCYKYLFL